LLSGSNGAGKTTVLDALTFLRGLFLYGHEAALSWIDGSYFRHLGTAEEEPVTFTLEVGEIRWRLRFPMSNSGLKGQYGEELFRGDECVLRAALFGDGWYLGSEQREIDQRRCCAKVLADMGRAEWMAPLEAVLSDMRIHRSYHLHRVQSHEPVSGVHSFLHGTGRNLWSVLSNWSQAPIRHGGKFDWVIEQARRAFPGVIGTIEFERGLPFLFGPTATDPADGLPPSRMADGLLTGLLHLTALAGAHEGAIVAFDEVENQLHPYAIRMLLEAMRERAEQHDLTTIITTHSPVVMNEFKGHEDQFYVLSPPSSASEGDALQNPCALDKLHDPDWLAHFVLGDLYERSQIAAPLVTIRDPAA